MSGEMDYAPWLDDLGERLPEHAAVLRRLTEYVRRDPRVVQLLVGCSVGRGVADALSDLDCHLSLEAEAWPGGLELIEPLVRSVGEVIDLLHHRWSGAGDDHRRTAVQYANGVQLDLMVSPVSGWSGMRPLDVVILHQSREVFVRPWDPARAMPSPDGLREWCFLGWWMLLDADKYLRRGSLWEAHQRLEEARAVVWKLAAAAQRLPFPEYGITALLDADRPVLPDGIAKTAAGIDSAELEAAVRLCAELLRAQWQAAAEAVAGDAQPAAEPELAQWALTRLRRS